jgi:hypothetical protein
MEHRRPWAEWHLTTDKDTNITVFMATISLKTVFEPSSLQESLQNEVNTPGVFMNLQHET